MEHRIEIALPSRVRLGEGPNWHAAGGVLLWVDILGNEVHAYDPATGADTVRHTAQHVGAERIALQDHEGLRAQRQDRERLAHDLVDQHQRLGAARGGHRLGLGAGHGVEHGP